MVFVPRRFMHLLLCKRDVGPQSKKKRKDLALIRIALIHDIHYLLPGDRALLEKYLVPGRVEENAG